jgi:hypothetical protein
MSEPSTFWDDLNRDLQDPEVRAEFDANAARIQAFDAAANANVDAIRRRTLPESLTYLAEKLEAVSRGYRCDARTAAIQVAFALRALVDQLEDSGA